MTGLENARIFNFFLQISLETITLDWLFTVYWNKWNYLGLMPLKKKWRTNICNYATHCRVRRRFGHFHNPHLCIHVLKANKTNVNLSDADLGDQSLSATAEALGQRRGITFVASTNSAHIDASPPRTCCFCSSVPEMAKKQIFISSHLLLNATSLSHLMVNDHWSCLRPW